MRKIMDVKEAVLSRRSIRAYEDRPIRREDLEDILEAGMYAPSAVNFQPWYFVAIQNPEDMKRLLQIMGRVSQKIRPALEERFSKHPEIVEETSQFIRQMGGAPVCILAFQYKRDYPKSESTIAQSIGAAIENMLLTAAGKGIGSCWLTAPVETGMGQELRDTFAPEAGRMAALLTFGYPARIPKAPARKEGRYIIL